MLSDSLKLKIKSFTQKPSNSKYKPIFMKRLGNIDYRIKYAKMVKNYLEKINKDQCLTHIGIDQYKINKKIILSRRIGSNSKFGVVYESKGTNNFDKLLKFASKIMKKTNNNNNEIEISKIVSELALENKNPHFPINYKKLECNLQQDLEVYPEIARKDPYYIFLSELADGDLKNFTRKFYDNYELMNNALSQILIAILSFHCTGFYHDDCHAGNFLYHEINPGGYFHYKIKKYDENGYYDIYIENKGYLWLISDYGLSDKISLEEDDDICYPIDTEYQFFSDYHLIIRYFLNKKDIYNYIYYPTKNKASRSQIKKFIGKINNDLPIAKNTNKLVKNIIKVKKNIDTGPEIDISEIDNFTTEIYFFENLIKSKLFITDLPVGSKVINSKPYIISFKNLCNQEKLDKISSRENKSYSSYKKTSFKFKDAIEISSLISK